MNLKIFIYIILFNSYKINCEIFIDDTTKKDINGSNPSSLPQTTNNQSDSVVKAVNKPVDSVTTDYVVNAVNKLADSVTVLSDRLKDLEKNFHLRFKIFGESIAHEKISLENIHSRLDMLDYLSVQVKDLESRLEDESSVIRNVLSVTNEDVKRLSTKLNGLEDTATKNSNSDSEAQIQNADINKLQEKRETQTRSNSSLAGDDIGAIALQKVESVLPRLLAAELNHFYLNMATKTDYSMGQLQTELVTRLRRIETMVKKAVSEIQDGRQDMSHITHLQRTLIDNIPREKENMETKCQDDFKSNQIKETFNQMEEKIVEKITAFLKKENFTQLHLLDQDHKDVGEESKHFLSSDLWKGVFSTSLTRPKITHTTNAVVTTKHCIDPTTFSTLEEVKQLLKTLTSKGEDLKRTLTEQTNEGVDLLKLLHQRFSVLLRRINTDPRHAEALLAEVQELEHLVENSYSSILLAQNLFIDACRRDQKQEPSIEGQIVEVLNKLVTNIDLGHQYNRKQLQEVRQLLEQMNIEEQSKNVTFVPPWISQNSSINGNVSFNDFSIFKANVFNKLVLTATEANSTEEKLQGVLDRINNIEGKLQTLNKNSGNVKNIVDELLTGAKDLKGYSRDQIVLLQTFQDNILKFVDTTSLNATNSLVVKSNAKEQDKKLGISNILSNTCVLSVLKVLNSSLSDVYFNNTQSEKKQITSIVKDLLTKATSAARNVRKPEYSSFQEDEIDIDDTNYYDIDQKDILMDDDHNWLKVRFYGNEDLYSDVTGSEKLPENFRSKRRFSGKISTKNEMTVLEDEFNVD